MAALLLGFVGGIIRTLMILHREKASIQQVLRAESVGRPRYDPAAAEANFGGAGKARISCCV
jgi:hypothetical protein